ncbi:MAG TPA: tetratricopeptide repeat protein [Oligoflexus sp.]|uniref:tetratricopeptide repeat protein n=1 Tax=Oligoflexus sp. TaxID=1971216 RepID=UPI002D47ABD5|nr:tetratricopeptide repeat protein [Oligoflexus sp.]HYX32856.1 tetratricopeptide repeat protein [Oligoflexus sp.]
MRQNKHELVEAEARRMLASNPQSVVARYYLASAAFRAGNRDEAISQLQVAQRMAPHDPRIKDTLEKARTAEPEDHIFTTSLSMSFDDLL